MAGAGKRVRPHRPFVARTWLAKVTLHHPYPTLGHFRVTPQSCWRYPGRRTPGRRTNAWMLSMRMKWCVPDREVLSPGVRAARRNSGHRWCHTAGPVNWETPGIRMRRVCNDSETDANRTIHALTMGNCPRTVITRWCRSMRT